MRNPSQRLPDTS